jgi:hypothetical protein
MLLKCHINLSRFLYTFPPILKWEGTSYLLLTRLILSILHNLANAVIRLLRVIRPLIERHDILPLLEHRLGRQRLVDGEAVAAGALPPRAALPAAADLVEPTGGRRAGVAAEGEHQGRDVVGLEGLDELLGEDGASHLGAGVGGDGVDVDVVLGAFEGEGAAKAEDGAFLFMLTSRRSRNFGKRYALTAAE